jgi:ligand-binding sensor domain-containing protein
VGKFRFLVVILLSQFINWTALHTQILPKRTYTTHNGLPQIQVTSIYEDSRGLVWIATKGGICYFSGNKFINISDIHMDDPTMISDINEISDGKIIFQRHRLKQMATFDGAKVENIDVKGYQPKDIFIRFVKNDNIYFNKINQNNNYVLKYNIFTNLMDSLDIEGAELFVSKKNEYKIKDKKSLYIYQDKWCKIFQAKTYEELNKINFNFGKLLFSINDQSTQKVTIYDEIMQNKVISYFYNNEGNVKNIKIIDTLIQFCIYDNEFIYYINKGKYYKLKFNNHTHSKFLIDRYDNLWHASENGIQVFKINQFEEFHQDKISDVWAFYKVRNGKCYYSGYNQGLKVIKRNAADAIIKFRNPKDFNDLYNYTAVENKNGDIYFAHSQGYVKVSRNDKITCNAKCESILALTYDSTEDITYAATRKGFATIDKNDHVINFKSELFENRHSVSIISNDQKVYIGNYRKLIEFDKITRNFKDLTPLFASDDFASAISLEKDHNEKFWIGGHKGLYIYDPIKQKITKILSEVIKKNVVAIKFIRDTLMCIGTNNELIFINPQNINQFKIYNYLNGFLGEEIAQNGLFIDYQDTLWIPSATCLTKIAIKDISFNEEEAHLRFLSINDYKIPWIYSNNPIRIFQPDVKINFQSVGFVRPSEMAFQYKINEGEWSKWFKNESIYLTGMGSGEYKIYLKSLNGSRPNPEQASNYSLTFSVVLPFYKEPSFHYYALLAGILFLAFSIFYFWIYRRLQHKSRDKEVKIKFLQIHTLQSQLNPHFIFNVLGTIQSLIINKNTDLANKYLVSFSKLIRKFLDSTVRSNSTLDSKGIELEVTLAEEIEMLKLYMDFEKLQYEDKFNYTITIYDNIDIDAFTIPPLLIQPFIENCIKHGLMYRLDQGSLNIKFYLADEDLICEISDNGVGRKKAAEIQSGSIKIYKSRGIDLVRERVQILNTLDYDIRIFTEDLVPQGTRVSIFFNVK